MTPPTKDELVTEAQGRGLDVPGDATKADVEQLLATDDAAKAQAAEQPAQESAVEAPSTVQSGGPAAPSTRPTPVTQPTSPAAAAALRDQEASPEPPESIAPSIDDLSDLSVEELMNARDVIDRILAQRREAAGGGPPGRTRAEIAQDLPVNQKATDELTAGDAAKQVDLPDGVDVLGYKVKQATDADGEPTGTGYLVVIDSQGSKHYAEV